MATKAEKQAERDHALETLRDALKPGATVSTVLRHVSRSGMSRTIVPLIVGEDGEPWDISPFVVRAGVGRFDQRRGGVIVEGCGMDMGFHLVYSLSRVLYPHGHDCTGEGDGAYGSSCPSNDHSNGDRDYTPHHHADGGYALRHRWL